MTRSTAPARGPGACLPHVAPGGGSRPAVHAGLELPLQAVHPGAPRAAPAGRAADDVTR